MVGYGRVAKNREQTCMAMMFHESSEQMACLAEVRPQKVVVTQQAGFGSCLHSSTDLSPGISKMV